MKKSVDANSTLLTETVTVETLIEESKDKKRAGAIDKEKQRDLRAYKAQLKREAKVQQDIEDAKSKPSYTWVFTKSKRRTQTIVATFVKIHYA